MLKKRLTQLGIIVSFSALLFSCVAYHEGMITAPQNSMIDEDVVFVDKVFGYSRAIYVFGIGGWHTQGLANQSMKNLMLSVDLNDGHYLDNLTYDIKTDKTFFPLFMKKEALISADLVQKESSGKVVYSDKYMKLIENPTSRRNDGYFKRNSTVVIYNGTSIFNNNLPHYKVVAIRKRRLGLISPNSLNRFVVKFYSKADAFLIDWSKNDAIKVNSGQKVKLRDDIVAFNRLESPIVEVLGYNPHTEIFIVEASNKRILKVKHTTFVFE